MENMFRFNMLLDVYSELSFRNLKYSAKKFSLEIFFSKIFFTWNLEIRLGKNFFFGFFFSKIIFKLLRTSSPSYKNLGGLRECEMRKYKNLEEGWESTWMIIAREHSRTIFSKNTSPQLWKSFISRNNHTRGVVWWGHWLSAIFLFHLRWGLEKVKFWHFYPLDQNISENFRLWKIHISRKSHKISMMSEPLIS